MKLAAVVAAALVVGCVHAEAVHARAAGSPAAGTQADSCKSGFVWRDANATDHVCVTPDSRQQVANENRVAAIRRAAPGSTHCKAGFVWREAFPGDVACVVPARRASVHEENRVAATRVAAAAPVLLRPGVIRTVPVAPTPTSKQNVQTQIRQPVGQLNPQPLPPQPPDHIVRQPAGRPMVDVLSRPTLPTPQQLRPRPKAWDPYGLIGAKYAALGGSHGFLGEPTGPELAAPFGGRLQHFKGGTLYWHPQIGTAYAVRGAIADKFAEYGSLEFGYPITDENTTPDGRGRYNHFRAVQPSPGSREASIYWTPETGAHEIEGLIRDAWAKNGWERSPVGYPTSDEFQDGAFRRSNFERGYIRWSQRTGIQIVLAGAAINAQAPKNAFGTILVNGMELALKDHVLVSDPLFLGENSVCGLWNAHRQELSDWAKNQALARINALLQAKLRRNDIGVRTSGTHVVLGAACSFRAEVLQACQDHVGVHLRLAGNEFQVYLMTPFTAHHGIGGDSDPKFVVRADLDVTADIRIPATPNGSIGFGPAGIGIRNIKLESHNVTADVIKSAVEIGSQFFMGRDLVAMLSQDRMFKLDVVRTSLDRLGPAGRRIPPNYRIDACLRDGNVFRLNATDVADRGPVVN